MIARIVRWTALGWDGIEHLELRDDRNDILAESVVIGASGGVRYGARYRLRLARDWTVKSLDLERMDGARLELSHANGIWSTPGGVLENLAGCEDIDLSGSPLTNTLPIRRLHWDIGQSRRLRMAYIPFDTLAPFPDVQVYTRLGPNAFRYQSEDGSFEQVLAIDADGLVLSYPTLFEML